MDSNVFATLSALAGTIVGGVTSFATSWLVQHAQSNAARLAAERRKREELYGSFMDEVSRLYGDALNKDTVEFANLVGIFAIKGRITLLSSDPVIKSADATVLFLIDLYLSPRRSAEQVRRMLDDQSADKVSVFARTCRRELERLR